MRLDVANARIGARRPGLLGPSALRELLARPTAGARLELLRAGPLGRDLPAPAPGERLGAIETALREGVRREAEALLEQVEGRRARALLAAFLGLEEAAAVKAVLRGVAAGAPVDRTLAAAPPVPGLPAAALAAAASAPGAGPALARLAEAGSEIAARVAAAAAEGVGPQALEAAADAAAFERARAACRGAGEDRDVLARHLGDRIDARNAATLLALAAGGGAPGPWLAGGSRLSPAALDAAARGGPDAARAAVARAFPAAAGALAAPWSAERALERIVLAPVRREARRRPLSIAVPLAYLAERRAEVRRVALVLRGAALGLPAEEILDLAEA